MQFSESEFKKMGTKEKNVPCLEYKGEELAWYEVSLKLQNDKLIIHFEGSGGEREGEGERGDEELSLRNVKDIQELKGRFRLPSRQLKDKECKKVTPGMVVCASTSEVDFRCFDARVTNVSWSKHMFVDGLEQCMCTYEVLWLAGPYEEKKTTIHCENIYLLQYGSIQRHPIIKNVVKYLQDKQTSKSQFAVETYPEKTIGNLGDNISKPVNPQVKKLQFEKAEKSISGEDCKSFTKVADIIGSSPSALALTDMEIVEKSFRCKPNIKNNILPTEEVFCQQSSNDNKFRDLIQSMHYRISEKNVLNGIDRDSDLCFQKQENRDAVISPCKSEGRGSEKASLAHTTFGIENVKDECLLKNESEFSVDGFTGGWLDDDSPRVGRDCSGKIEVKSDNGFYYHSPYFSVAGDASNINGHKEILEDHLERLDDGYRISSLPIIEDENGDMGNTETTIKDLSRKVKGKNWDAAQKEQVINACTVYSQGRSKQPKVRNDEIGPSDSYIRNCGQNIECEQPLDELKTPHLRLNKRKKLLLSDFCNCVDVTCNREEEAGTGVHICIAPSIHHRKQHRYEESQSVKGIIEANFAFEKEQGDTVGEKVSVKKNNSQISTSCRLDKNYVFQLYRPPCGTVETDNVIEDNQVPESTHSDSYTRKCGKDIESEQTLDGLETPHLRLNKRKKFLLSDFCNCVDVTCNWKEESGTGVHNSIGPSIHHRKQRRFKESQSVKAMIEANAALEKEQGDTVDEKASVKKSNSQISTSCRLDKNDFFQLYRPCGTVETDNVIEVNQTRESAPMTCCGHRECYPENHPSKHTASKVLPSMQCHDVNGNICNCHLCYKNFTCRTDFHVVNYSHCNTICSPQKEDKFKRLHHDYCAEYDKSVGNDHYHNSQSARTVCCSVHYKEIAGSSLDCIGDDNKCLVLSKDKLTDIKEQSEQIQTGNFGLPTYQPLGIAVVMNEGKCNSMEQAVGSGRKKELKDQHKSFPPSHVLLLENLEKDVTPSDVFGVIHQAGGDFVKVYICPSESFEKFTRGFICFEDQASFQRVSEFVRNEKIIIASSKGRPWVVIDAESGLSEGSFGGLTTGSECHGKSLSSEIQILSKGSPAYERAEKLKGKFMEWWEGLKLLHRALAYEETVVY